MRDERTGELRVIPANEASWDDLQSIFSGTAATCQCTRQRLGDHDYFAFPKEERRSIFRAEVNAGQPDAEHTIGLVGYLGDEPVAWCAVDRRVDYTRLLGSPVPWKERPFEKKDDETVWSVACIVIRAGFRRRGYSYPMVAAAVEYARSRGADAIEGYPILPDPGKEVIWDEIRTGAIGPFLAAGFREVSHPTKRRKVVRIDF